ncbi:MAG: PEP-CTERM sorting domain-containing protein [Planctomycetaceae bacterium]|nr:PEP-CTERM sorting domain-containing protein [Planctomycetaceae bacterium]
MNLFDALLFAGWRSACRGIAVFALAASFASTASATIITFGLGDEYSGGADPAGPLAWATATFDDLGGAGTVKLKLEAKNLSGSEFISVWNFNLDPALDPTQLVFSAPIKTGTFAAPSISTKVDAFKAGPAHGFDIQFSFATKASDRFGAGESVEYTITGIPSLTASSFNFLSAGGGGAGKLLTGAHIQSIADVGFGSSGWVTIPEPSSFALAALGLLAGATLGLRRKRARPDGSSRA